MPIEETSRAGLPTFRKEAIVWAVAYRRKVIRLPAIKGLDYLSRLVATPGARVPASELAGRGDPPDARGAERDRVNVTKGIKEAIKRIAVHHPELGLHLEQGVRTGAFCSYLPVLRLQLSAAPPPRRGGDEDDL